MIQKFIDRELIMMNIESSKRLFINNLSFKTKLKCTMTCSPQMKGSLVLVRDTNILNSCQEFSNFENLNLQKKN